MGSVSVAATSRIRVLPLSSIRYHREAPGAAETNAITWVPRTLGTTVTPAVPDPPPHVAETTAVPGASADSAPALDMEATAESLVVHAQGAAMALPFASSGTADISAWPPAMISSDEGVSRTAATSDTVVQVTAMFVTLAWDIVPVPPATTQLWVGLDGWANTVTWYVASLASGVAKTTGPLAVTLRSSPSLSRSTSPEPARPETVPATV